MSVIDDLAKLEEEHAAAAALARELHAKLTTARRALQEETASIHGAAPDGERARLRRAEQYTESFTREFTEELAGGGWATQPGGEVRAELEEAALAGIAERYDAGAAEYCRTRVLPFLGQDSGVSGFRGGLARPASLRWETQPTGGVM